MMTLYVTILDFAPISCIYFILCLLFLDVQQLLMMKERLQEGIRQETLLIDNYKVSCPFTLNPLTHPLNPLLIHLPTHSYTYPLTHTLTHSLIHLPTHSSTHPLIHLPTHSSTYPLTHPSTHPPTHSLILHTSL